MLNQPDGGPWRSDERKMSGNGWSVIENQHDEKSKAGQLQAGKLMTRLANEILRPDKASATVRLSRPDGLATGITEDDRHPHPRSMDDLARSGKNGQAL